MVLNIVKNVSIIMIDVVFMKIKLINIYNNAFYVMKKLIKFIYVMTNLPPSPLWS